MSGSHQRLHLSTDPTDPKYRIRVEHDDGLFTIAEDFLSSARVDAQITRSRGLSFTTEEMQFIHDAYEELRPFAEAADGAANGELRKKGSSR